MPMEIVQQDICNMKVDAIVNAANTSLQEGGGVCGAIFRTAGARELQQECDAIGGCQTGQAVLTSGYNLPAPFIIHTVGPIWRGGGYGEAELLQACYYNSLRLAQDKVLNSIAFPLISSGIYGYPKAEALSIATSTIAAFLAQNDMRVYLVILSKDTFCLSEERLEPVQAFIDEHYRHGDYLLSQPQKAMLEPKTVSLGLNSLVDHLDESFSCTLLRLIDAKGKTDVEIYKRANIDRRLFSKIRSSKGYMPSKRTAVALAIALELSLAETKDLLERAGYTLSRSQKFDVIIEYFISRKVYNIFNINEALFFYDQPLLGG